MWNWFCVSEAVHITAVVNMASFYFHFQLFFYFSFAEVVDVLVLVKRCSSMSSLMQNQMIFCYLTNQLLSTNRLCALERVSFFLIPKRLIHGKIQMVPKINLSLPIVYCTIFSAIRSHGADRKGRDFTSQ